MKGTKIKKVGGTSLRAKRPTRPLTESEREVLYRGKSIDENVPTEALDRISTIKNVKVFSALEGDPRDPTRRNTKLTFVLQPADEEFAREVARHLDEHPDMNSSIEPFRGKHGWLVHVEHPNLRFNEPGEFERWWLSVAEEIIGVVHETRAYKEFDVDIHLPREALNRLNDMDEIEVRGVCEGHGTHQGDTAHLAFVLPSPLDRDEKLIERFVIELNKQEAILARGPTQEETEMFRIGEFKIPGPINIFHPTLWYEKDPRESRKWWLSLPAKIERALTRARKR